MLPASARICAMFPGQGTQFVGMGKKLAKSHRVAAEVFEEVDEAVQFRLSRLMFEGPAEELGLTEHAQPAILAVSIAAARSLQIVSDITPKSSQLACAAGHSLGEYSARALVFAGSVGLADAARLVKLRGQAMQAAASHIRQPIAMSALLFAKLDRVLELCKVTAASCGGAVEVANINSSDQVVISGVEACVAAVEAAAKATGAAKKAIRLNVSAPFHCSLLQPAAEVLSRALASINFATPVVPVLSNVTAEAVTDASMFATLLTQQVCAPVDWLGCMQSPSASACDSFLEVGPGVVLSGLAARIRPKSTIMHCDHVLGITE